jgi:hypothetical protein
MAKRQTEPIRHLKGVTTADDDKTIYAAIREQFTAAHLQKYTEIDEGIPMEQVLAELEAIQPKQTEKRNKKRKKKP